MIQFHTQNFSEELDEFFTKWTHRYPPLPSPDLNIDYYQHPRDSCTVSWWVPSSNNQYPDWYHYRLILSDSEFHMNKILENCTVSHLTFSHITSVRLIHGLVCVGWFFFTFIYSYWIDPSIIMNCYSLCLIMLDSIP